MPKILSIIGARPQFIKYSAISRAMQHYDSIEEIIIHTGQHYDYQMSEIFFEEMQIPKPHYNLEVGSGSHAFQTAETLQKTEEVLLKEKPDWILIFGDTNATLAGALAATKLHIPIAHIEAGLRSYNRYMPEEINRVVADNLSNILLCPSTVAVNNLKKEGYQQIWQEGNLISDFTLSEKYTKDKNTQLVINVGDVMYDTLIYASKIAEKQSMILDKLSIIPQEYGVLTLHRAENTTPEKIKAIFEFVKNISQDTKIIFPVHPRTKKLLTRLDIKPFPNIFLIDPLGYYDLLKVLKSAKYVLTDSGGMQKEAFWLQTPCVTLREQTEWVETIETGWNVLYKNYTPTFFNQNLTPSNCYGNGKVSKTILDILLSIS